MGSGKTVIPLRFPTCPPSKKSHRHSLKQSESSAHVSEGKTVKIVPKHITNQLFLVNFEEFKRILIYFDSEGDSFVIVLDLVTGFYVGGSTF